MATKLLAIILIVFQSVVICGQQSPPQQPQKPPVAVAEVRNVIPARTKDCSPEVARWWDDMNAEAGQISDTLRALGLAEKEIWDAVNSGRVANLNKLQESVDFLYKRIDAERIDFVVLIKSGSEHNLTPPIEDHKVIPIYTPRPDYTEDARKNRITGFVVVNAEFGDDGIIGNSEVISGLGHGLDEKAIEAVRRIIFVPTVRDGHFVTLKQKVRVSFQLL